MVKVCAIKNCRSGSRKAHQKIETSVSFFQPTTPAKLKNWTKSLGILLKATDYVCQFHFPKDDVRIFDKIVVGNVVHFYQRLKKNLREGAIPTITHQFEPSKQEGQFDQAGHQQQPAQQQPSEQQPAQQQPSEQQPAQQQSSDQQPAQQQSSDQQPAQQQPSEQQPAQQQSSDQQPAQQQSSDQQPAQQQSSEQQPSEQADKHQQIAGENQRLRQDEEQQQISEDEQRPEQIEVQQQTPSIMYLKQKLAVLPQHWLYIEKPNKIEFMRLDPSSKKVLNHVALNQDYSISVICANNEEIGVGQITHEDDMVFKFLKSVETWLLCVGTQIEKQSFSTNCRGVIIEHEAYRRRQMNPRCQTCRVLRWRLQKQNKKVKKSDGCLKQRADNVAKKFKRFKKMKLRLRQEILESKSKCAKKTNKVVQDAIKKLPKEFQTVVSSCFEAAKKIKANGRRYTLEWIYECLLIRLKSRNTYELLRARGILPIPSLTTLNRYLKKISSSAYGFQTSTFNGLKEHCKSLDNAYKRGSILVDEMKLSENIYFDSECMKFNGFVDLGQHTPDELKNKSADHALVFQFVPFRGRWTQVLGCFLSRSACTSVPLHKLILECMVLLENSGIHVDSVITDGATWNRGVWKIFGIDENNISYG